MPILLFAATDFEIESTIAYIQQHGLSDKVTVQITGIGLTAAVYSITSRALTINPSLMIQAGIAGSFDPSIALAETVIVGSETLGDLGVFEEGRFKSIFDLRIADKHAHPFKNGKLINPNYDLLESLKVSAVDGVSVQEITTNQQRADFYRHAFGAQIETMEGAALHYVGLMEHIPFIQLRAISNYVGERNKKNWKMMEAIQELNKGLQAMLAKLIN